MHAQKLAAPFGRPLFILTRSMALLRGRQRRHHLCNSAVDTFGTANMQVIGQPRANPMPDLAAIWYGGSKRLRTSASKLILRLAVRFSKMHAGEEVESFRALIEGRALCCS